MKKYVKPQIMLEHYELSQNIAACAWQMNNNPDPDGNSCYGIATGDDWGTGMSGILFGNTGCTFNVNTLEGYCYQNGGDGLFSIFRS